MIDISGCWQYTVNRDQGASESQSERQREKRRKNKEKVRKDALPEHLDQRWP